MDFITVKEFFEDNNEKFRLNILAGEEYLDKKKIVVSDINRPGLALAGFFGYFPYERIQVFGKTEFTYIKKLGSVKADRVMGEIFKQNVPCIIISRNLKAPSGFLLLAKKYKTPVFETSLFTTKIISATMIYLEKKLAPKITMHGTFVDVYGLGVLITGKSGIGKSEVTLELVKRGHRLVADDLIEVTRLGEGELEARGMSVVQHHMEIRGVGIIDVRTLFGVGAVRDYQKVELVLHLEEWEKGKDYERLGIEEHMQDILGVQVPKIVLPVKPGRTLSIIVEVAAMNQRLRQKGHNPAKELNEKIMMYMGKGKRDV
ncbi:MAG: HPr(Ser) kinase/phosphatase [Candidatus Goldiibacteriota bacterium HGW-Goldbacteria-1]|jgi:HPr kinase/phosphorylase|nr:MAG: HPr(Ser) kinase/phosphatase [Candidatus Goldiibacteriota bacterium HGW-Goldbacteria-1]